MARSRVIKPEFWSDEKLARVSRESRLTFVGLWNVSDDYGVAKGNTSWIKSQLFPYDEDLKITTLNKWLSELEVAGFIIPFQSHDENFYYIRNFSKHQKVDHPSKQRNAEPPLDIDSQKPREILAEPSRQFRVETETETETEYKLNTTLSKKADFETFWQAYPKKRKKADAFKAWSKQNGNRPPIETLLAKLTELKASFDWTKEGGQFIPLPASWLNSGGWDDQVKVDISRQPKVPTFFNQENT